jgi:hypothetical protein
MYGPVKTPIPPRRPVRTKWSSLVAVCRECSNGKRLSKALKRSLKDAGVRDVRVLSSSCLDVCPKRGVTVATAIAGTVQTAVIDDALDGRAVLAAVILPLHHD